MDFIYELIQQRTTLKVQAVIGVIWGIILLILFLIKSSRDERGRAIIGRACIISNVYFMVMTSVVCRYMVTIEFDLFSFANLLQFIFNTVIGVQIIAILLFKKFY